MWTQDLILNQPEIDPNEHLLFWVYARCSCWDDSSYIDKLKMACTFHKLLEPFFPLSCDFEMVYISLAYEVCILYFPVNMLAFKISPA